VLTRRGGECQADGLLPFFFAVPWLTKVFQESSSGSSSSGDSGDEGERGQDTSDSTFASQFEDGLVIDSDDGGGDLVEQYDDGGFATSGVGDDNIPTYDLESLVELQVQDGGAAGGNNNNAVSPTSDGKQGGFQKTVVSADAAKQRTENGAVRAGALKRASPLEELRQVFKTTGGLKLARDFTERYLFKISADGYHVGWVADAGSDYDFYNTKHEIVHSEEKREVRMFEVKLFAILILQSESRCNSSQIQSFSGRASRRPR
jgi:hypothetical protein